MRTMFLVIAVLLFSISGASSQPVTTQPPTLTVQGINVYSPDDQGGYNYATVNMQLLRPGAPPPNSTLNFNLQVMHVKDSRDAVIKVKDEIRKLGDEFKKASESFDPH